MEALGKGFDEPVSQRGDEDGRVVVVGRLVGSLGLIESKFKRLALKKINIKWPRLLKRELVLKTALRWNQQKICGWRC
jgi:hypothetical protein